MTHTTIDPQFLQDTTWLEQLVIARTAFDPQFGGAMLNLLGFTCEENGKPEECNDFSSHTLNAAFQGLRLYLGQAGYQPSGLNSEFYQRCLQYLADQGRTIRMEEVPSVYQTMGGILSQDWRGASPLIDAYTPEWLKKKRTGWITNQYQLENKPAEWLNQRLNFEARKIDKIIKGNAGQTMFGFGQGIDNPEPDVPRIVTRLQHLNRITGGGYGKGEGTLVIAASGVGKTAKTVQTAVDFVTLSRQKGLIVSTEEKHYRIERRIISNYCKIPIGLIKDGFNPAKLGQEQLRSYEQMRQVITPNNLQIYNWPKDGRSVVQGLEEDLKRAGDLMGGIDFIILDWLGGALGAMETDERKIRLAYQNAADTMARLADQYKIVTISFAQAHPDRGVNKMLVDARALAECKQLHREMTTVIGISGMYNDAATTDPNASLYQTEQCLFISKARYGEGGVVRVKRKMEFQAFLDNNAVH